MPDSSKLKQQQAPPATPVKSLSFAAILAIAANTMNGPAFTTLPDVAGDAGSGLYVVLIALSVAMAAFVCRRLVYAMWSSLDHVGEDGGVLLGFDGPSRQDSSADATSARRQSSGASWLSETEDDPEATNGTEVDTETTTLIPKSKQTSRQLSRPLLAQTSIVGHTGEAYGNQASLYVRVAMIASALCLALAQMMICAAILDGLFVAIGGKSCALGLPSAESSSWIHCTSQSSMKPYAGSGAPVSLLSMGTAIAAVAAVVLGTYDLDEMMSIQYFLFGCLVVSAVRFSWVLRGMAHGLEGDDAGAAVAEGAAAGGGDGGWFVGPHPFQTIGPIMFNFAFVVTSPPSVVLAKEEGIAYKALGMSCAVMGAMYTMVGLSGAAVATAVQQGRVEGGQDSNLLSLILLSGGEGGASMIDLCIIGMFGFSTMASIPVYCLLAKQKIMEFGIAPLPSFLLSNVVPWMIVALTYNAAFFEAFVNWSGLLILGYANFSLPLALDLKLKQTRAAKVFGEHAKTLRDSEARTTALTKGVLILVTASITLVIVVSIANSLPLALAAFLLVTGLMARVLA